MSELFDDEDDKVLSTEDEIVEEEDIEVDPRPKTSSDARRRLEDLLEEKRLRDELQDIFDDY